MIVLVVSGTQSDALIPIQASAARPGHIMLWNTEAQDRGLVVLDVRRYHAKEIDLFEMPWWLDTGHEPADIMPTTRSVACLAHCASAKLLTFKTAALKCLRFGNNPMQPFW